MNQEIPIWQKFTLTIPESAKYFSIGENKLRRLVKEFPTADFVVRSGNKTLIKRVAFEKLLTEVNDI